jgi:predicted tellurium resistance membrane protein TerC
MWLSGGKNPFKENHMELLTDPNAWIALLTLTALEIVLGIDNIIFISILTARLPAAQRPGAQKLGIAMAMLTRILLLFSLTLMMKLTKPLFIVLGNAISGRDLILIIGGLFLLGKSTLEIHNHLEGEEEHDVASMRTAFWGVIVQVMILDIIFSLDSVITAIGMVNQLAIMVAAIVIAVGFMLVSAAKVSGFIDRHPTVRMLALSFLLLVGVALIGDGFDLHIPRGYIYFAMGFSVFVEMLNLRIRRPRAAPIKLRQPLPKGE